MPSELHHFNEQFRVLNEAVGQGKVISTSLQAENKPKNLLIKSILTFGIYYAVYKYQHDKKRVFKKMTSEMNRSISGYSASKPINFQELQKDRAKLQEVRERIQNSPEGNFAIFTEMDELRSIFRETFEDNPPRSLQEKFLRQVEQELSAEPPPPHWYNVTLDEIRTCSPKKVDLSIDVKSKNIKATVMFSRGEKVVATLSRHLDDPVELKKEDVLKTIDKRIGTVTQKLESQDNLPIEEQKKRFQETELQKLQETIGTLSSLAEKLWGKSKDPKKLTAANQKLQQLQTQYKERIETVYRATPEEAKSMGGFKQTTKAVTKSDSVLERGGDAAKNNFDTVLDAVTKNGSELAFAADKYKNDRHIVLVSVKTYAPAIKQASEALQKDVKFLCHAVETNRMVYDHLSDDMKRHPEIQKSYENSMKK